MAYDDMLVLQEVIINNISSGEILKLVDTIVINGQIVPDPSLLNPGVNSITQ